MPVEILPKNPSGMKVVESQNVLIETENYWIEGYIFSFESLVITFENLSGGIYRPNGYRDGWSSVYFRKRQVSHLAVKPKMADWYQKPDLPEAFTDLKESGFLSQFENIVTYGASMGGFAAIAFSDLVGAHVVLALNPQSTMDKMKLPDEERFPISQRQDWTGPYADAAKTCSGARSIYVFADMYFKPDRNQVDRIATPNTRIFNVPFLGHGLAPHLQRMKLLSPIVDQAVRGCLDENFIMAGLRARRELEAYYSSLLNRPRVASSKVFSRTVREAKNAWLSSSFDDPTRQSKSEAPSKPQTKWRGEKNR